MNLVRTGPGTAFARLLLAHGAGAPMDSPFMQTISTMLEARGLEVLRFEFGYMSARRTTGRKRPAPKAELLAKEYISAVVAAGTGAPLLIGGKSMGGRVASLVADQIFRQRMILGLVCLGYPFRPAAKPEQLRTAHLSALATPALIVQGERDPFGGLVDVERWRTDDTISPTIQFHWAADGDHDLGPRGASGFTRNGNLNAAADAIAAFARQLG